MKKTHQLSPEYKEGKKLLANQDLQPLSPAQVKPAKRVIDVAEERKKLENTAFAQDIRLKKLTLFTLFGFLGGETVAVFILAFFQATHAFHFALEEWSFKLILVATITQITLMVQIAVKHLFPVGTQPTQSPPATSSDSSSGTQTSTPTTSRSPQSP